MSLDPAAYGFEGTDTWVADTVDLDQNLAPDDPDRSVYQLVFPHYRTSEADPTHHAIQIAAPASFGYEDHWRTGPDLQRGEAYRELKQDYAMRLIRRADLRIPGLREHIVAMDVATPLTTYRYTLNDVASPIGWGYNNPLRWSKKVPFIPACTRRGIGWGRRVW